MEEREYWIELHQATGSNLTEAELRSLLDELIEKTHFQAVHLNPDAIGGIVAGTLRMTNPLRLLLPVRVILDPRLYDFPGTLRGLSQTDGYSQHIHSVDALTRKGATFGGRVTLI